jgi:hypothetical protein
MTPIATGEPAGSLTSRGRIQYLLTSLVVLAPCYWLPRIQAGDLSSHIYNAWLAQLVEGGRLEGLRIAGQTTNVLFDLVLGGLFRFLGPEGAQRAAVSLAVLVFVWGAFAFVSVVAGRRAWHLIPAAAMLAYGWVFHMGMFNFYLAMGLCFWVLALAWRPHPRRLALAAAILVVAYTAHALPVAWSLGLLSYAYVARKLTLIGRAWLLGSATICLVTLHLVIGRMLAVHWTADQFSLATGADQVWVFDGKYYLVALALLLLWVSLFANLLRLSGGRQLVSSIPFHLSVLSAAVVCILPTTILIPGFRHALVYIAERMSLGAGICVCALLGSAPVRAFHKWALLATAGIFFAFLWRDERALNRFEDGMTGVIATLEPMQRVVSPFVDPELRVNALAHMVDRACLERCFSYANYEPSTAQFRVRAAPGNLYVAGDYGDSWDLQNGKHVVRRGEPPLVRIGVDTSGRWAAETLKEDVLCRSISWDVLRNRMMD